MCRVWQHGGRVEGDVGPTGEPGEDIQVCHALHPWVNTTHSMLVVVAVRVVIRVPNQTQTIF